MYNNQDILKKHTALTISRKDVDTSFIMFPVRMETRFVEGYPVEDVSEPDKVLYAFKSLWHYVEALRHGNTQPVLLDRATKLMERVEGLDTVYREDRARLRNISAKIVEASRPTGELAKVWERIRAHIPRLATLDTISDNEATEFLRKLDRVDRTVRRMVTNPDYNGKKRSSTSDSFSQSARFKAARRHMKDCLPVLEQLLPEDPAKSIVNRFSHITKKQFRKYVRVMRFFEIDRGLLSETYQNLNNLPYKLQMQNKQILEGLENDFSKYDEYYVRYWGGGKKRYPSRVQSLRDKMRSKVGRYHHYTLFAEKMILWDLRLATTNRDTATNYTLPRWRGIASSTIFSFHEERLWLLSVLEQFNAYQLNKRGDNYRISPERINQNNRFIRKRKLRYRKQQKCLLIRIYPDQVAVTQMARGLSADEIQHARLFWLKYFHAATEVEREAAWKSLCSFYPPSRAAFIARKQFPNNLEHLKALKVSESIYETPGYAWLDPYFPDLKPVSETGDMFPIPVTELMPDRFIVQAKLDNGEKDPYTIVQYGRLIPKTLQVGLDLNNKPQVEKTASGLKLGGNLRWMTDYAEAERLGMAITIPLESYKYDHYTTSELQAAKEEAKKKGEELELKPRQFQFQSIYVTGVKEFDPKNKKDSEICSRLLQELFNAHLYGEEGLDLLKLGTPTNILGKEEEESAYDTSLEAQIGEFYRKSILPLEDKVPAGQMNGDADLLSYLFGIAQLKPRYKDNPFLNTLNRDNAGVLKQCLVNEAFLKTMASHLYVEENTGEEWIYDEDGNYTGKKRRTTAWRNQPLLSLLGELDDKGKPVHKELYNYFVKDVSPVGVFPSFRIGDQPYGIVPVCDFQDLKFRKGDPLYLVYKLLMYLTDKWNALAQSAVISEENMYQSGDSKLTTEERYLQAVGGTPYSSTFYWRWSVSDPELLDPNYFNHDKGGKDDPISTLRAIISELYPNFKRADLIRDYWPEYGDIFVSDLGLEQVVEDFDWGHVKEQIRDALQETLGEAFQSTFPDEKELEMYITGTFDLFNYRLDAWLTGLLRNRLGGRMHFLHTHKVAIGAYGWVFNLKEDFAETQSYEYIVAPSINQAITAAVLRSSFNRSAEGSTQDYSLNVNLSSSRVRQALRIIDGVRNGLSVGAVLGSDLERALHEEYKKSDLEMDYFIYFLRQTYPLNSSSVEAMVADKNANADKGFRDVTIDVLNGSALLDDLRGRVNDPDQQKQQLVNLYNWEGRKSDMIGWLKKLFHEDETLSEFIATNRLHQLLGENYKARTSRLITLIQEMEDAYDALADVVTSESVYKLTQGNQEAVEALMNSLQTGRNIPEPEVTEIPLTSAHIEQRVFVALDTSVESEEEDDSILRQTEPRLDQWMGQVLGFDRLAFPRIRGKFVSYVPLAEIGVSPSELVYLSGDWEQFAKFLQLAHWLQSDGGALELEDVPQRQRPGFEEKLQTKEQTQVISLEEAEWAVDSMREMVSKARELRQSDLIATTESPEEDLDRNRQMDARYDKARDRVAELADTLFDLARPRIEEEKDGQTVILQEPGEYARYFEENPYLPLPDADVLKISRLLLQCFRCGVMDAISGVDSSLLLEKVDRYAQPTQFAELLQRQKSLVSQMGHISEILYEKIEKADARRFDKDDPSGVDAVKELLLSSFRMIRPFRVDYNPFIDAAALEKQQDPKWFGNVKEDVLEEELTGLADVRTQLNALHQVRMFAQWNGLDEPAKVTAMQIDTAEVQTRSWLGTQVSGEQDVHDANVYTVLNASRFIQKHPESSKYMDAAGLMIDFWAERIPYRRQTAALAFAYDQPDAEPPQAILVGVSPIAGHHRWSEKRMIKTIRSAMYQVKSRAVEPEHLYADPWTSVLFPLLHIKRRAVSEDNDQQN